jgi:hypothetical protein
MAVEILCGTKWSKDCNAQPDPKFSTNYLVIQNVLNEGGAQKNYIILE